MSSSPLFCCMYVFLFFLLQNVWPKWNEKPERSSICGSFFFKCREQCVICIIGDSLSILLKLIRCLGAPLMKAYFNDLCCLFLWVKPPSTEEEGRGDNELIKMLTN